MATPLFLRKFRFVLRLGCPLSASNSTLSSRKVIFRRTCRRKNDCNSFAAHKRRNSCFYHGSGSGKKSRSNRQAPASEGTQQSVCGTNRRYAPWRFLFLETPSRRNDSRTFHVRQSCRILETTSLQPPQAALRLLSSTASGASSFSLGKTKKKKMGG